MYHPRLPATSISPPGDVDLSKWISTRKRRLRLGETTRVLNVDNEPAIESVSLRPSSSVDSVVESSEAALNVDSAVLTQMV